MSSYKFRLDIGKNTSLTYKNLEAKDLFDTLKKVDDEDDDEYMVTDLVKLITEKRMKTLGKHPRVIFAISMLEMNCFDGTGYHFQDMSIKLYEGDVKHPLVKVKGYIEYALPENHYLYKFPYDGKTAYLAILHEEGPGYGSSQSTTLAIVLP